MLDPGGTFSRFATTITFSTNKEGDCISSRPLRISVQVLDVYTLAPLPRPDDRISHFTRLCVSQDEWV